MRHGVQRRVARKGRKRVSKVAFQKTIANRIETRGVALHSGVDVTMAFAPAPAGTGIVFRRTDLEGEAALIPARFDHVADTRLCTVIANRHGASVATIEHIMAALAGMEIDNVFVELSGAETPVMDGSARPFVDMLRTARPVQQDARRKFIRVLKEVRAGEGDYWASLKPADEFSLSFNISFANPLLASQSTSFDKVSGDFVRDIASARTFCLYEEIEGMWAAGLAKGGSLDNAVVVKGDQVMNPEGLRFEDESVRHKALDAIGDLYTAGHAVVGAYHGERAGHALNNQLLRALFADPANYAIEEVQAWDAELVDAAD